MLGLNPWLIVGVLVALIVSSAIGFGAGVKLTKGQFAREEVTQLHVEATVSQAVATALAKQRPINQFRTQVMQREIVRVPDYSRCLHSDDGLRILNDALDDKPVAAGDLVLPEANEADGKNLRSNDNEAP